jgi:hypothetical protein
VDPALLDPEAKKVLKDGKYMIVPKENEDMLAADKNAKVL